MRAFENGRWMKTISIAALWIVFSSALCFSQTAFKGIEPGRSTRADVVSALGQPVRSLGVSSFEYRGPTGIAKVQVTYGSVTGVVSIIVVYTINPITRSAMIQKLELPAKSDLRKTTRDGKLIEYFGGAALMSLAYASPDESSGVEIVRYYSRHSFSQITGIPIAGDNGEAAPNSQPKPTAQPASTRQSDAPREAYQELIDKAWSAYNASDYTSAVSLSQRAVSIERSRPDAYEIIGASQLYGMKDVGSAVNANRATVNYGGTAIFSVTHDDDGMFQTYCQGTLSISRDSISFKSNDGRHSFSAASGEVKEAALNTLIGSCL
jgi:hypothetical protein